MLQTKLASGGKRSRKAIPVLGIAGVTLAASASGSAADIPAAGNLPPPQGVAPFHSFLAEEEISDVSLATFHLFSREDVGSLRGGIQMARGGCGCGHGGGCGGHGGCGHGGFGGHGGRGFVGRGCRGRGCGWGGCGGCGWGYGYGGCCLSWGGCNLC